MDRENLVEQHRFLIDDPSVLKNMSIDNLIIESTSEETKWFTDLTNKIGDWRGIFRTAYIKWAITINGLYTAKDRYTQITDTNFVFNVKSLRLEDKTPIIVSIADWDASTAAKNHFNAIPMIYTYGFTDLYNCLEEFVFDFYRIYWQYFPENLIKGPEFRNLRKLKRNSNNNEESKSQWLKAFNERLDNWQRKKLYDNLGKVFLAFCKELKLQKPTSYETSPKEWAESITGISLIRNIIVHGGKKATKELSNFCAKPHSLAFDFNEGDELEINLLHLQTVELFLNQLLTAINLTLVELFKRQK